MSRLRCAGAQALRLQSDRQPLRVPKTLTEAQVESLLAARTRTRRLACADLFVTGRGQCMTRAMFWGRG